MSRPIHPLVAATASLLVIASCARADKASETPAGATPAASEADHAVTAEAVEVDVGGAGWILPRGLTSFGATSAGGSLFLLGGYFGSPHSYSEAGQSGDLLRLDLGTGTWEQLGSVDKAQGVALAVHGQQLVRIGGMQARNQAGQPADLHSLATAELFDIASSSWTSLPPLPKARSSHDAIVSGDTVWVVGGWTLNGEDRSWHDTILALDLRAPNAGWESIDAPFRRRALATVAVGGKIIALGGIDSERNLSSALDVYDPATRTWSKGPDYPSKGFGIAAVAHDDALYASGMDGVVRKWRPGAPSWTDVTTLAFPRFFHRLVATPEDGLLVVGGIRAMQTGTRVRPIERIDPAAAGQPSVLAYDLKSPLPTKNRQGVAVVGDEVIMFGGNTSLGQHDFEPEFFASAGSALDLASMTWRPIAPYPQKRQTMSAFATEDGRVVSVGGFGHDGEVARSHPEVFSYDVKEDAWTPFGKLPAQGRTQFGLAVREDEVVLFGGLDYDPRRKKSDQFRHELGLLAAPLRPIGLNFTASKLELRTPRRAFASALVGDTYYVIGGMQEDFKLVESCEAYDFSKTKWRDITCPRRARLSAPMVALDGKLYLAAGSSRAAEGDKLAPDPSLEVYDPTTNTWSVVFEKLPVEPKHLHMQAYGDRLLLVSTHNENKTAHVALVRP